MSKKICKACVNKYYLLKEGRKRWNHYDDERWQKGNVVCVACNPMTYSSVNLLSTDIHLEALSSICPYFLEHVMENAESTSV